MSTDTIGKLYKNFSILAESKDGIGEHTKEYLEIMAAVKGSPEEKRLASQFITRFFKYFPSLAEQAIECLFDLCEDEDITTCKQAIKYLPSLCKDNKQFTHKIADILAQLLQVEDASELSVVNNSLMALLKIDPKGCLSGLFSQILSGEDFVREKCIKFLTVKVRSLGKDVINHEAETFMIAEVKKVLQDVTANEFNVLMELLGSTKLGKSLSGHQELVDLVAEQVELDHPFSPGVDEEAELLDRLINCVRHALPYFSIRVEHHTSTTQDLLEGKPMLIKTCLNVVIHQASGEDLVLCECTFKTQISSSRFVSYICEQILPQLDKILTSEEDSPIELDLLKVLAELCTYCGTLTDPEKKVQEIYNRLLLYMPLPPVDGAELTTEPRLEFSFVECLMYAFHKLARQCPEFLSDADRLKDFKIRLQYFARGIQGYIKKLREALCGKTAEELKSEDNRLKVVALKTTSNINVLIKDLFHSPPSFKSVISLSWKPIDGANRSVNVSDGAASAAKRHTPITFEDNKSSPPKQRRVMKESKELYTPPSGKYSNKLTGFIPPRGTPRIRRGSFRQGGRGKFRGRTWRRVSY